MEFTATALLPVTIPITFIVILLLFLLNRRLAQEWKLPPGPWGVPLLGCLPFLDPNLHRYLAMLAKTYGPILSFRLGTKLHIAVTSPALATEIFKTNDAVFANHAVPSLARILNGGLDVLWSPHGPYWRMVRKVAVHEVLSTTVIESFQPLRRREIQRMLGELRSSEGRVVNLRETASSVSLSVMLGMIWDGALKEDKGRLLKAELIEVIDGIAATTGAFNIADFIPMLEPLDLQGLYRRVAALAKRFDVLHDSIIKQRLSSAAAGETGGEKVKDFLQILLDLVQRKDPQVPLEIKHVKALLQEIIFAGTDTTATAVEWAMTELMRNPRVIAKAWEELDSVVGRGRELEESHLPKLEYVGAVLKETMRLHTVLPLLVPHSPSEPCRVGGYTIPKGASVMVNVWAIHRDPSIWDEPLEFRPERFLEHKGRWDFHGWSPEFLPFAGGRRKCAGAYLGERIAMYTLGSLVHNFRFELPDGTKTVDVEDTFGIMLKKKDPLHIVPIRR